MPYYICNKNADDKGRHEVHDLICSYLPEPSNRLDLGYHSDCASAIRQLEDANRGQGFRFDGCFWCCNYCHKG